jgi:hypothetical protein
MARTVFFSWQSDIPQNRRLIREAIDLAIEELSREGGVEEAARDLTADQDTQGVSGSPSISDTILTKIRGAFAFIADLTFVASGKDGRLVPNPNVLIEYGYALHALGDSRIISVLNEAYGAPAKLPFDLLHKRWPIRFSLPENGDRQAAKRVLTDALKVAIGSIAMQFGDGLAADLPPEFSKVPDKGTPGLLRTSGEPLCIRTDGQIVTLKGGPYMFVRLYPKAADFLLGDVEARQIAQRSLRPMGRGSTDIYWGRHETGAVVFGRFSKDEAAYCATELYKTKEIWGIDQYYLSDDTGSGQPRDRSFIPTGAVEEVFIHTVRNYLTVAQNELALNLPMVLEVGLVGIKDYTLAVDRRYFFGPSAGHILSDSIVRTLPIDEWSMDVESLLRPFFEDIYDAAGETRPNP